MRGLFLGRCGAMLRQAFMGGFQPLDQVLVAGRLEYFRSVSTPQSHDRSQWEQGNLVFSLGQYDTPTIVGETIGFYRQLLAGLQPNRQRNHTEVIVCLN